MFNSLQEHLTNDKLSNIRLGEQPLPRAFRINAKNFSITWPKCPEPNSVELSLHLQELLKSWKPQFIRVAKEFHKDGTEHYHAAICLSKPLCTRDARFFDWRGHHANIQPTRHVQSWIKYIGKDGCFTDWGSIPEPSAFQSNAHFRAGVEPSEIIRFVEECKSRVEFLCWAAVNKLSYAKEIWNELKGPKDLNTIKEGEISMGKLDYRFEQLVLEVAWVKEKCLIIVGESGIGKTTYATNMIPKPALLISHIDDLRKFKPDYHLSILFDDVCFNHYPIQSQIHLVDYYHPRSIHVRYAVATIPAGTFKIFTCNENPVDISHPAISRRCQILKCHQTDLTRYN